jgi:hypothetical protein
MQLQNTQCDNCIIGTMICAQVGATRAGRSAKRASPAAA